MLILLAALLTIFLQVLPEMMPVIPVKIAGTEAA